MEMPQTAQTVPVPRNPDSQSITAGNPKALSINTSEGAWLFTISRPPYRLVAVPITCMSLQPRSRLCRPSMVTGWVSQIPIVFENIMFVTDLLTASGIWLPGQAGSEHDGHALVILSDTASKNLVN